MSKARKTGFHVVIPAAGAGTRTGLSTPKQYAKIGGKMVLRHTIEKFLSIQGLISLRVIIDADHRSLYEEAVQGLDLPEPVIGGATRKESVFNAIALLSPHTYHHDQKGQDDFNILIHDAARPFVSEKSIYDLLAALEDSDAATLAAPIADTLLDDRDDTTLDRKHIWSIQTPQGFQSVLLGKAHAKFENDNSFTDDASLVRAMGGNVTLVPSGRDNFKITTAEDLIMAEKLLTPALQTLTGFGYDVHAFDPAPADKIRLGGIDIPHTQKLLGHSDADVILHALTDAILGTIGEGDIGQLFPPSDMQWKGADSEIFVKEAVKRLQSRGGTLINADITLICEAPKIGPHRLAMQNRIADMLGLPATRIGLKATTSEGLGFIGRKEGIVAQAVVSVTLPC